MGCTTCLGLHSQTTRLCESVSWGVRNGGRRGSHPLRRPFPGNLGRVRHRGRFYRLQFADRRAGDFQVGLFPVHSPLLGESWLVSFPPLIDMLKFSGWSCLISGRRIVFSQVVRPRKKLSCLAARSVSVWKATAACSCKEPPTMLAPQLNEGPAASPVLQPTQFLIKTETATSAF